MRNAALVRVLRIAERLRGGSCSLEELARDFGVSMRTVRRDLDALDAAGQPVRHNNAEVQSEGSRYRIGCAL